MVLRSAIRATMMLLAGGSAISHSPLAASQQVTNEFTVGDIRIEGLQRISEGTVYNYLPVNIGDRLDENRVAEALRALYATGFFRDVEARRDGGTLIVAVLERPSIESFEIKGNKDIKTEDLQSSLRNVGLAMGKTFDQSVLDEVKRYLTDQYYSRGKYAVRVDTKVDEVANNKVKISIDINEGARARIRQINVVGNNAFEDEELLDQFALRTPNWLSFYRQDDRYAREALSGDLEKLKSYYMDRGYANFQIDSTQVAVAPEKDDIFLTVNVNEGEVFKVSDVKLAGSMVVPESELQRLIQIKPGDTFSRKQITQTTEAITARLGVDGYAFAKVDPVPQPDTASKNGMGLTFLVDPGQRVYVRRINFNGAPGVNDEVFRREMRQLEGGYLSNTAVDRSKQRIRRLPFIESVEVENTPVAGTPDQVDVNFQIKEGLPGQFGGGIGYSGSQSAILNLNFVHTNFMGSGNRIAADINTGRFQKTFSFSQTDPYTTLDGVSRTMSFTYRDINQFVSSSSEFSTKSGTVGVDYGYPITEFQTFQVGLAAQRAELLTVANGSAAEAIAFVQDNGDSFSRGTNVLGSRFTTYELNLGWKYDSRNRAIFADRGTLQRFNLGYTLPMSDVEFYTASYEYLKFVPLFGDLTLLFHPQVAYGQALGGTTALPPYRQFFAGGAETVRGFRDSRLGPQDSNGNPYGGNLQVVAQTELLLPIPEKFRNTARFSLFFDMGNVFSTDGVDFVGPPQANGQRLPADYKFSFSELRQSAGLAVQWLAPLGVFRFSYALPLKQKDSAPNRYGDETEGFQFSIGQAF